MNERRTAAYVLEIPSKKITEGKPLKEALPVEALIGNIVRLPIDQSIDGREHHHTPDTHIVGAIIVFPGDVNGNNNAHHEKDFKARLREQGIEPIRAKIDTLTDGRVAFKRLRQAKQYERGKHVKVRHTPRDKN